MISLKAPERPQDFTVLTVQFLLLITNGLFITSGEINNYIILSLAAIFSLFILQTINHRFLLLNPINMFMGRFVKAADTIIVQLLIIISTTFLSLGAALKYLSFPYEFKKWIVYLTASFLLIVLPLFWLSIGYKLVRNHIVKKLKKKPWIFPTKCSICQKEAIEVHKVLSWKKGIVRIVCYGKCASEVNKKKTVIQRCRKNLYIAS